MVTVQEVDRFLMQQRVDALPGVGWSVREKLEGLGIMNVAQLRSFDRSRLQAELGLRTAADIWDFAWGKDCRKV
jgi:DNA repair protein REV1